MRENEKFHLVREYLKELSQNGVTKNNEVENKPGDTENSRKFLLLKNLRMFSQELEKEFAGTSTFQKNSESDIFNHYEKIRVNIRELHELLSEQVPIDKSINNSRRDVIAKNEYYHRMATLLFVDVFIRQLEKEIAQLKP